MFSSISNSIRTLFFALPTIASNSLLLATIILMQSVFAAPVGADDFQEYDDLPRSKLGYRGKVFVELETGWDLDNTSRLNTRSHSTFGKGLSLEYFVVGAIGFGYRVTDASYSLKNNPHEIADMTLNTYELTLRINFADQTRFVPYVRFGIGGATGTRDAFVYQYNQDSFDECFTEALPHSRVTSPMASAELGTSLALSPKLWISFLGRTLSTFSLGSDTYLTSPPAFGSHCNLPYQSFYGSDSEFSAIQLRFAIALRL